MKTYQAIKAVGDALAATLVYVDTAFHKALQALDDVTISVHDLAGKAAVRSTNKVVRREVQRLVLLRGAVEELQARVAEAEVDVEYVIDEQHHNLIEALNALPTLSEELQDRLNQAIEDDEANRVARV